MTNVVQFAAQHNLGALKTVEEALAALAWQVEIGKGKEAGLSYSAKWVEVRTPKGMGRFTWKEWEAGKRKLGIGNNNSNSNGEECDGE